MPQQKGVAGRGVRGSGHPSLGQSHPRVLCKSEEFFGGNRGVPWDSEILTFPLLFAWSRSETLSCIDRNMHFSILNPRGLTLLRPCFNILFVSWLLSGQEFMPNEVIAIGRNDKFLRTITLELIIPLLFTLYSQWTSCLYRMIKRNRSYRQIE